MQTHSSTTQFDACTFAYEFTGKDRDNESRLDYFGARYYSSGIGWFMSPDPINLTDERLIKSIEHS